MYATNTSSQCSPTPLPRGSTLASDVRTCSRSFRYSENTAARGLGPRWARARRRHSRRASAITSATCAAAPAHTRAVKLTSASPMDLGRTPFQSLRYTGGGSFRSALVCRTIIGRSTRPSTAAPAGFVASIGLTTSRSQRYAATLVGKKSLLVCPGREWTDVPKPRIARSTASLSLEVVSPSTP
eukprot:scaffold11341_cov28-Tisochrysis_lutea.AAC.4